MAGHLLVAVLASFLPPPSPSQSAWPQQEVSTDLTRTPPLLDPSKVPGGAKLLVPFVSRFGAPSLVVAWHQRIFTSGECGGDVLAVFLLQEESAHCVRNVPRRSVFLCKVRSFLGGNNIFI